MPSINFDIFFSNVYGWIFGERDIFSALDLFLLWWGIISVFLSVCLIMIAAYLLIKINELQRADNEKYAPDPKLLVSSQPANPHWERVQKYLGSESPAEWKLAILEADTMLADLLEMLGYRGESLGERLKAVEPSDFLTLNDAWEAHKVRNQIAHEKDFVLTQREVRRVIDQFERVFKEFNYI
ncbi:MAG TPA: hypothetical protein VEB60_02275 [Candidatus Paceibacterota bacterium]|nr:hypothetical protein [Candidatus Paceibacterota bacterium]